MASEVAPAGDRTSTSEREMADALFQLAGRCMPQGTAASVGVDVVEIGTLERDIRLGGDIFLKRVFTPAELKFSAERPERLASRFAAKEAVSKALGTGIRGVDWQDIEVRSAANGAPTVALSGAAAEAAVHRGIATIHISLCHEAAFAVAVAIGESVVDAGAQREVE